jgi:class 3 adenylate cyclase
MSASPSMVGLHAEIAASIERTLTDAARRNELRIAWVRVVALVLTSALNTLSWARPRETLDVASFSPLNPGMAGVWALVAAGVAALLQRGWYRPWLRIALPVMDGVLVFSLFGALFGTIGPGSELAVRGALVNIGATCTLLALTGSLRLTPIASWLTTGLAIVDFAAVGSLGGLRPVEVTFVCVILLGAGMLGEALAAVSRRAVQSEVGRLVLQRFLPDRVVAGAHQAPIDLLTTPRSLDATVLVSDLRGFTRFAEGKSPDDVLAFLNRIQGLLAATVQRHGGTVDKFMGDGMLAVFGAPEPVVDHAARAVRAAREMVAVMASDQEVRIGIGVHSGRVVCGCLGSGLRLEFTIIGDAVNIASRLEALTKEKQVTALLSAETVRLSGATSEVRDLGNVSVRGRQGEIRAFTFAS